MMARDPIREYHAALRRRTQGRITFRRRDVARRRRMAPIPERPPLTIEDLELARSRRLVAGSQSDFASAIRVLQRHNRLLRARFGVGWVDAASVVREEAGRRGASAGHLARVLAAGLRSDAKEAM